MCVSSEKASLQEQFQETSLIFNEDFNSGTRKEDAETLWVPYCIIFSCRLMMFCLRLITDEFTVINSKDGKKTFLRVESERCV